MKTDSTKWLLIIDDHPLFLKGMLLMLDSMLPDLKVMTANTFSKGKQLISETSPALVLLDLAMPDHAGLESLRHLTKDYPTIPVAILSAFEEIEIIERSLVYGARGYISKTSTPEELIKAIKIILSGQRYIPPAQAKPTKTYPDSKYRLSPRQHEILECVSKGMTNKAIAEELFISEGTVKQHLSAIFKILNVKNRTKAVQIAKNNINL